MRMHVRFFFIPVNIYARLISAANLSRRRKIVSTNASSREERETYVRLFELRDTKEGGRGSSTWGETWQNSPSKG